jgi:hypothetical protein
VEQEGVDEWSIYFNYLSFHYPENIESRKYETLAWPASMTDWSVIYEPDGYSFENYYEFLYEKGMLFEGLPSRLDEDQPPALSETKVARYRDQLKKYKSWEKTYQSFCRIYQVKYNEDPSFCVDLRDGRLSLVMPHYLALPRSGFVRIPVTIYSDDTAGPVDFRYSIIDDDIDDDIDSETTDHEFNNISPERKMIRIPVWGYKKTGSFEFVLSVKTKGTECEKRIPLFSV